MGALIICGSRDLADGGRGHKQISEFLMTLPQDTLVITGGAWGADWLGALEAYGQHFPIRTFPADWKKNGKGAGPKRNREMLAYLKTEPPPRMVLALPTKDSKGTRDMIKIAEAAEGVDVRVVEC